MLRDLMVLIFFVLLGVFLSIDAFVWFFTRNGGDYTFSNWCRVVGEAHWWFKWLLVPALMILLWLHLFVQGVKR